MIRTMRRIATVAVLFPAVLPLLPSALPAQKVEWWQKSYDEALVAAKDSKAGMVLLYCWREKDGYCESMFGGTLSDKALEPVLAEFVCIGLHEGNGKPVFERYGIQKVPSVLFVLPDGKVVDVVLGYVPVQEFQAEVARIRAGTKTIAALRDAVAAKPDDLALQLELLHKLRNTGDRMGALAALDAIVKKDPKGASEPAAEALLMQVCDEVFKPGSEPKDWDTKPLRTFLGKQKQKRILFLGYDRLAAAEWKKDNLKAAVDAAEKAWKNIPPELVLDWGQNVAGKVYEAYAELEKIDKTILKRAVDVSEKALAAAEKKNKAAPDNAWLANAMYLHASVLIVANQRKEAFALMDKAMALDPKNENLKKAKDRWVDGSK